MRDLCKSSWNFFFGLRLEIVQCWFWWLKISFLFYFYFFSLFFPFIFQTAGQSLKQQLLNFDHFTLKKNIFSAIIKTWTKCCALKSEVNTNSPIVLCITGWQVDSLLNFLQPMSLGLFRCDYFFCCQKGSCLQVEFNTVASSFGGISSKLSQAHKLVY